MRPEEMQVPITPLPDPEAFLAPESGGS